MIRRIASSACALLLAVAFPLTAMAGHPGGGGGGGGGGRPGGGGGGGRPGGAPAAAPAARPQMAQPAARPAGPPPGSFNVQRDIAPVERPRAAPVEAQRQAPIERQAPVERPVAAPAAVSRPAQSRPATANRSRTGTASRPGTATASHSASQRRTASKGGTQHVAYRRAPVTQSATGGQYRGHFHGSPVRNPREHGGNWAWNHGRQWQPAGIYWGGGFWGPFALAGIAGFALFGAIDDSQDGYVYDSYRVEPDTPGADLLNDYGLEQVACGPPGLVDIWGPDGSIVCAVPNDSVAPGDYQVDPQTFTLVPATN